MAGRTAFDANLARTLIDRKRDAPGATLPILHDLQDEFGYIDDAAIPLIADALNISRAETLGVVSFYHDFRRSPIDGRVLKLCRAESCQAMGCEDLVSHLSVGHGIEVDGADEGSELHVEIGLLPRKLRPLPRRAARRRTDRPPRPRSHRRDRRRRPRENAMSVRVFVPAELFGAVGRRKRRRRRDSRRGAPPRPRHCDRAHRIARPLLARAAGRGRDCRRPRRLWSGRAGRGG